MLDKIVISRYPVLDTGKQMSAEIAWQISRLVTILENIEKQLVEIDTSLHPLYHLCDCDEDIAEVVEEC